MVAVLEERKIVERFYMPELIDNTAALYSELLPYFSYADLYCTRKRTAKIETTTGMAPATATSIDNGSNEDSSNESNYDDLIMAVAALALFFVFAGIIFYRIGCFKLWPNSNKTPDCEVVQNPVERGQTFRSLNDTNLSLKGL